MYICAMCILLYLDVNLNVNVYVYMCNVCMWYICMLIWMCTYICIFFLVIISYLFFSILQFCLYESCVKEDYMCIYDWILCNRRYVSEIYFSFCLVALPFCLFAFCLILIFFFFFLLYFGGSWRLLCIKHNLMFVSVSFILVLNSLVILILLIISEIFLCVSIFTINLLEHEFVSCLCLWDNL
jgi:hypothetical protein